MRLTTEHLINVPVVTAAEIDHVLGDENFGTFAVLAADEDNFIQAGNDWQDGPEATAFFEAHASDPWVLEYRDGATGRLFRAAGHVTLDEVREAFLSYLVAGNDWRLFTWEEFYL
jgi:hypothetical protein